MSLDARGVAHAVKRRKGAIQKLSESISSCSTNAVQNGDMLQLFHFREFPYYSRFVSSRGAKILDEGEMPQEAKDRNHGRDGNSRKNVGEGRRMT